MTRPFPCPISTDRTRDEVVWSDAAPAGGRRRLDELEGYGCALEPWFDQTWKLNELERLD
jgi:hypothetical protein